MTPLTPSALTLLQFATAARHYRAPPQCATVRDVLRYNMGAASQAATDEALAFLADLLAPIGLDENWDGMTRERERFRDLVVTVACQVAASLQDIGREAMSLNARVAA